MDLAALGFGLMLPFSLSGLKNFEIVMDLTKNMTVALTAINKWLYYGWNYPLESYTYNNGMEYKSEYLPMFLAEVKWTCSFDHMVDKWKMAVQCGISSAYLTNFYAILDMENRRLLIEWVMKNYNDEMKIVNEQNILL